jgi:hypothetical protein
VPLFYQTIENRPAFEEAPVAFAGNRDALALELAERAALPLEQARALPPDAYRSAALLAA